MHREKQSWCKCFLRFPDFRSTHFLFSIFLHVCKCVSSHNNVYEIKHFSYNTLKEIQVKKQFWQRVEQLSKHTLFLSHPQQSTRAHTYVWHCYCYCCAYFTLLHSYKLWKNRSEINIMSDWIVENKYKAIEWFTKHSSSAWWMIFAFAVAFILCARSYICYFISFQFVPIFLFTVLHVDVVRL